MHSNENKALLSPTSPLVEEAGEFVQNTKEVTSFEKGPKESMRQYLNDQGGIINNDNSVEEALPGKFLAQNVSRKEHEGLMDKFENRIELF